MRAVYHVASESQIAERIFHHVVDGVQVGVRALEGRSVGIAALDSVSREHRRFFGQPPDPEVLEGVVVEAVAEDLRPFARGDVEVLEVGAVFLRAVRSVVVRPVRVVDRYALPFFQSGHAQFDPAVELAAHVGDPYAVGDAAERSRTQRIADDVRLAHLGRDLQSGQPGRGDGPPRASVERLRCQVRGDPAAVHAFAAESQGPPRRARGGCIAALAALPRCVADEERAGTLRGDLVQPDVHERSVGRCVAEGVAAIPSRTEPYDQFVPSLREQGRDVVGDGKGSLAEFRHGRGEHPVGDLAAVYIDLVVAQRGDVQQVRPFRIRRLETPAQQRALRSRQSDPVSRPARRLQDADAEPPDRAPCRYAARIVPDADFPVGQRGGCQRPPFVGNQHGSAGGHAARVPKPGPFAEQFRTVRRDADFIAALAEVAAGVGFPTEMRTGGVDGERIGQVLASQLLRAHGLLGAAAGEQQ